MKITEQENEKLKQLYATAKTTPVIAFSVQDGLEGKDLAHMAWDRVREYMDELAKKYGYDPSKYAINPETREVVPFG